MAKFTALHVTTKRAEKKILAINRIVCQPPYLVLGLAAAEDAPGEQGGEDDGGRVLQGDAAPVVAQQGGATHTQAGAARDGVGDVEGAGHPERGEEGVERGEAAASRGDPAGRPPERRVEDGGGPGGEGAAAAGAGWRRHCNPRWVGLGGVDASGARGNGGL